jgi:nickel superoxide dismutase
MVKYNLMGGGKMNKIIVYCIFSISFIFAHCQVPCGIYDDVRVIIEIEEHIQTIDKAMNNILNITSKNQQNAQDMNQLVRWINTKEEHAQKIQDILMKYFLAQRIKPKQSSEDGYARYVDLTLLCQNIIYISMKSKQTVELSHLEELKILIDDLVKLYFDEHGIEHLRQLREK